MRILIVVLLVTSAGGLTGCFGRDKSTVEPPAELVDFDEALRIRRTWNRKVGGGTERLRLGLSPATDGSHIFAGSHDGTVSAFNIEDGDEVWSVDTELPLAAGPAYGSNLLVFGTSNGDLVALDARSGEQRWRKAVGSEVLSAPAIGSNVVVFRSVDGRLRGFSVTNGNELWSLSQTMPPLTLRGNTTPRVAGPVVVSGFDNGRVGAYSLTDGEPRWELAINSASGASELERLVDISAGLQIVGNDVYVVGYQGSAVGIDLTTGLVLWQQEMSSYAGLGVDGNHVYVTDDVGAVVALDRRRGTVVWRQEALRLRDVTAPARFREAVVVGDFEGYLHWLEPGDGAFLARVRGASDRISGAPLVVGLNLYVQADDGTVAAFEIVDESA